MFHELQEHPGLWFVAATLMPAASFAFLLLAGGLRWALRPVRESGVGQSAYQALGGDRPGPSAAYVATGAMVLAFLCSLIGGIQYLAQSGHGLEHTQLWAGDLDWTRIAVPSG